MAKTAADILVETLQDWGVDTAKLGEALLRGEPNRGKIAVTVLADKIRELV